MDIMTLAFILVPIGITYFWYAGIISKRNRANEALSGVDVQLKKRSSLIPNILKIAQKFMEHEKSLLTEITELRSRMESDYSPGDKESVQRHLAAAEQLDGKMGQLMVAVEDYPDLKSDATMVQAMQSYNEVEAQIAAARRFYNSAVTSLNNAVQIFPGNLIARMAGVAEMPFYEVDEASRAPVDADDYLK
ncbi:MAG: LemA family protein [Alphaproteobacteria bacterium]